MMNRRLLAFAVTLFAAGCARDESDARDSAAPAAVAADTTSAVLAANAMSQLRWLDGSWRGSGNEQAPFYERYRVADDSTMVVEGFPDSTFATANDTSQLQLRGGRLSLVGQSGSRWVATALSESEVTFAPAARATNGFTWRRESADAWTAIMRSRSAGDRIYRLTRVR